MGLAEPPVTLLNGASLFLDFDGTLVEMASKPDAVEVGEDLIAQLQRLRQKLDGRVALLSGRPVADVRHFLGAMELPIGGSHGLERALPGVTSAPPSAPPGLRQAITILKQLETDHPGVHIEEKPAGVAIHYRLAPDAKPACQIAAEQTALAIGMILQHGKMVVELRPSGADKGTALRLFMAERLFAGTRPIFIGDDLTDEHAFVAAREFDGAGVLVGPARASAAIYRLDNVAAVRSWLNKSAEVLP